MELAQAFDMTSMVECRTRLVDDTPMGGGVTGRPGRMESGSAGEGLSVKVDDKFPERVWNAEYWEETSKWRVGSS